MENLIEQYQDKKAQIAGAILEEEKQAQKMGDTFISRIDLLEAQADLYQAMIELAEANLLLQESMSLFNKLQKKHEI